MWAVVNRVAGNALRSWELGWKLHVGMVFGRTKDSEAIALLERGERRVREAMVVAEKKLVENEVVSFDLHVPPDLYIEEMRFTSAKPTVYLFYSLTKLVEKNMQQGKSFSGNCRRGSAASMRNYIFDPIHRANGHALAIKEHKNTKFLPKEVPRILTRFEL